MRRATATQWGPWLPIRSARPSMGAFTHLVASSVVPWAVLVGSGWVGKAEAAAVATAAYTMTTVKTDERTLSGTDRSGSFASAATLLTFSRPV